ncbi:hypothetical protein DL771_000001 [Monosporascus sp. 5C6A]|nr:hypothetical protein DL771_000001 [Monosporascus sp. 5C6A]
MEPSGSFRVDGLVAVVAGGGTGKPHNPSPFLPPRPPDYRILKKVRHRLCDGEGAGGCRRKEGLRPRPPAVDAISKETGFVNLLIANSGIYGPPKSFAASDSIQDLRKRLFEEVSMESFTETFHVNVTGAYFTVLAFLEVPAIQSQVTITSSVSGFSRDENSCPAYAGSKAATTRLAKHASTNLAVHDIRVNALAPGICPSEIAGVVINSRRRERAA